MNVSDAFDKVRHNRLIENFRGMVSTVKKRLDQGLFGGRTQSVVVNGTISGRVPALSCVTQGSDLGPCLFLFYTDGIAAGLNSFIRLFVDGTMIYITVENENDALIQSDLDLLTTWEHT